jgi:hypothetical protein
LGKAARNREIRKLAELATVGKPATEAKSLERSIRRREHDRRRARPLTRRQRYLEHVARTQPAEHRR